MKERPVNPLLMKIFFVGFILIGFQIPWSNQGYAESREIIVATDKNEYRKGEVIKITLRNELNENIFSHAASLTPIYSIDSIERKNPEGNWDRLFAQCQYPNCIYDMDSPVEIKPEQNALFEWNPLIYLGGKDKYTQAESGVYRLLVIYQLRQGSSSKNWKWLKVYSNEFTIK